MYHTMAFLGLYLSLVRSLRNVILIAYKNSLKFETVAVF